jgi:hypothetical protein
MEMISSPSRCYTYYEKGQTIFLAIPLFGAIPSLSLSLSKAA